LQTTFEDQGYRVPNIAPDRTPQLRERSAEVFTRDGWGSSTRASRGQRFAPRRTAAGHESMTRRIVAAPIWGVRPCRRPAMMHGSNEGIEENATFVDADPAVDCLTTIRDFGYEIE
jgi:hypothetical protein